MKITNKNVDISWVLDGIMYDSTAYARHFNLTEPKGIMIHSSIVHHSYLRWFIRPTKKNINFTEIQEKLGYNQNFSDYNHTHRSHNFHYWVGKDKHDEVMVVKTLPTSMHSWENDRYIHICICEDNLTSRRYLYDCMIQTLLLCKELCKEYSWTEKNIIYYPKREFQYWFNEYGYNQKWFRLTLKNQLDKEKNF